ncbi:MAG: sigma-70 family RNA polymerase sigma factor [Kofleriaceae bacterium]
MPQDGGELHHDDLAWARALAANDLDALARYERELVPVIDGQLRRRGHTEDEVAELQQQLRVRLLVGDGEGPRIASYTGSGRLRSWVLVSALREAVRARQSRAREPAFEDDALIALADRVDLVPGTAIDKERYRRVVRIAFRAALQALAPRERNLLRMNVIDGLSIDQIGAVQGVHRATAARWLERAREQIARSVRRELMTSLGADPFEAEELLHWVQSRIELSLSGLATDRGEA